MIAMARHLPRFRAARRGLVEIEARERWSPLQMKAFQLDRLNELWAHAAAHVPYYRHLLRAHVLPRRFESLEQYVAVMPLLEKEALRASPDDFRSPLAGRGTWRATSGSTGVPMRFFASAATHQSILRYQYRFRQVWGIELFDRAAFLIGSAAPRAARGCSARAQRLRETLTDRLRGRIRLPVHQMARADLARQLERITRLRPAYLYGYSRAIHLLALEAAARGFRCDALRVVMMTSEPALGHMVAAVERAFGVPAVIEYGSTECGVTAYEWRDRTLRVRSDRCLLETLPRADGRYDIVKTVLDNFDFPLFRYRIEDLTDAPLRATDQAFPVLENVAGRNDDVLYAADGTAVHPAEIDGVFESSSRPSVRRYRVHQNAAGEVDVQVEPAGDAGVDLAAIREAVSQLVPGRTVRVEAAAAIAQTAAGKHRPITSDCRPRTAGRPNAGGAAAPTA